MSVVEIGRPDQRVAAAGMLAAGALSPLWASHGGVPCPLRTTTGIPCPFCGMTRSVCAALTGHPRDSLLLNPLGIVAVVVAVWLVVTWRRGPTIRIPVWLPCVGLAGSWLWQLVKIA
ncbi:MAG: hypothetical protein QOD30_283 [Actinomycetota bacterium]|nr:hypothetical protein [Actinomycetota bacterium]